MTSAPGSNQKNIYESPVFFLDNKRSIDFVLARKKEENYDIRFEDNLEKKGLELEREVDDPFHFTKVHAPIEVLRDYAELLMFRMPKKESNGPRGSDIYKDSSNEKDHSSKSSTSRFLQSFQLFVWNIIKTFWVDEKQFPKRFVQSTGVYKRTDEHLFDIDCPNFFSPAIRSQIVRYILDRTDDGDNNVGIDRLISKDVYVAAYPLHDGEITSKGTMRYLLYTQWANISKFYRLQPLDYIKDYFGVKIGLYFAWLGFYTNMLVLASIVGIGCFLYGVLTIDSDILSNEICSNKPNATMCPLCDRLCDFWSLNEGCIYAKIVYLIDNSATIFFAIFMSFWASLFLKFWQRYLAAIKLRWDLTEFDLEEEHPRPQYPASLICGEERIRINPVANHEEPHRSFSQNKSARAFSASVILLFVALNFAIVFGIVVYRISILTVVSGDSYFQRTYFAPYLIKTTGSLINLLLIFLLIPFYSWLAVRLTEGESHRTQTEFDNSLSLKMCLLRFVNFYASTFYIAFVKGKFIGYPGNYNRLFGEYRQEECVLGGCLIDLSIQLAVIMIGKQIVFAVFDMKFPGLLQRAQNAYIIEDDNRWVLDLKLLTWGPQNLLNQCLKIVLQYGVITFFATAFPLSPLLALLNNIFKVRFDAKNLLKFYRRPVIQRIPNIGVWYHILDIISRLSVLTNGFIIAFTSEFIPRFVYQFYVSPDGSLYGFVNSTLSYFNTTHFESRSQPHHKVNEHETCRYYDYRSAPGTEHEYELTKTYWIILAARLSFVLIFEIFVDVAVALVDRIPSKSAGFHEKMHILLIDRVVESVRNERVNLRHSTIFETKSEERTEHPIPSPAYSSQLEIEMPTVGISTTDIQSESLDDRKKVEPTQYRRASNDKGFRIITCFRVIKTLITIAAVIVACYMIHILQ